MLFDSKSIAQIIRLSDKTDPNSQKLAMQFLKLAKLHSPLNFSSVGTPSSFFPRLSVQENIMLGAGGNCSNSDQNLRLVEVLEDQGNALLMKLMNELPSPQYRPDKYKADELWCYDLIQAILKEKSFLFIHSDQALKDSSRRELVQKILLARSHEQKLPSIFTQQGTPVLHKIIGHRILLTDGDFIVEKTSDKKIESEANPPLKLAS